MKVSTLRFLSGCFVILKDKKSKIEKEFYFDQLVFDDYFIYKCSMNIREAKIEDVLSMKNSGYIFFRKDAFIKEDIDKWVEFLSESKILRGYIAKPFPPLELIDKIKIKK